jgi:TetR/AcrR family transcriptional repressor of mexJK operon
MAERHQRIDPRVVRSRAAIIAAAVERFLAEGYAADLDDIARDAGVSKKTIYNVIGGKELLFRETLPATLDTAERVSGEIGVALATSGDVRAALRETAERLSQIVLSEAVVNLRRLLISVADRFPALVRDYYEQAPGRVVGVLAEAFATLDRRGLLEIDDPTLAAEHFAYLAVGADLDRGLFGVSRDAPSSDAAAARAMRGADAFYRAYRPAREGGSSKLTSRR